MTTEAQMSEVEGIADELRRVSEGEAWHGPSIRENLAGVTAADAAARPIPTAHTIWEITLHMAAWATEVERRLRERAQPLAARENWPQVDGTGDAEWESAKASLFAAHARLRQTIREFPATRLARPVGGETDEHPADTFYVMLHGLAQHDAYHTGQIAMLRRAMAGTAERVGLMAAIELS